MGKQRHSFQILRSVQGEALGTDLISSHFRVEIETVLLSSMKDFLDKYF